MREDEHVVHSHRPLPRVSIVTPAYNQGMFLSETIESVLGQDYPNIEYIVIDDGSTDDTAEVISRYAGRLISRSRDNRGQAATLNEGWALATGDIIGYLSSDDLIERTAVSELVTALVERPSAVVVYSDFELVDAKTRHIRHVQTEDFDRKRLIVDLVCQPGPGALFRKSVFEKVGGWNPALRQVPDFEFWTRVSAHGDFVRIPRSLAKCRVHEESASFRRLSAERCDEVILVVQSQLYSVSGRCRASAEAKAYAVSAKRHLNSGRSMVAVSRILKSIALKPSVILQFSFWRMMMAGLLRRHVFISRAKSGA